MQKFFLPLKKTQFISSVLAPYFSKVRGEIKPGAYRVQKLLNFWIDEGILNVPAILVTGSNGKGSVCAYLERILREHGFKTGLYTSPHLVHPNERIRISGIPVTENILEEYIQEIQRECDKFLPDASFFEITTAVALLIFFKQKVDFLICEVGLGGRFDSTNVISPLVSVLTSVSLEHTQFLGNSLKKIAMDKSHVSRRNKPFVVGLLQDQALEGVKEISEKIGSQLCLVNSSNNLEIALSALNRLQDMCAKLDLDANKIITGVQNTFWPGRFDIRKIENRIVIFDAAHNPAGFSYFVDQFLNSPFAKKKCVLLFASLNDKDWKTALKSFHLITEHVILSQFDSARSEDMNHFLTSIQDMKKLNQPFPNYEAYDNLDLALEKSMNIYPHLPLVVTGSIAFIGSVMERLGVEVFEACI